MLQHLYLEHFKCFELLKLPLAPLTLLTGLNASGKSTTIQALALLHQTLTGDPASPGLVLNGTNVALGTADELIDKISGRDSFAIGLENETLRAVWRFGIDDDDALIAPLQHLLWEQRGFTEVQREANASTFRLIPLATQGDVASDAAVATFRSLHETLQTLTYISADRIGPRELYPASSRTQQTGVGARGEFAPWFIDQNQDVEIPAPMCRADVAPNLRRQTEAWLAAFFPGSALEVEAIPRTNQYAMRLRTNEATRYHRPTNVGYGLSHVLPVIAACLGAVGFARQQQRLAPLVLVENPELHLHPAGQSAMGVFLARAAASGAQVIIETHSDHVLNGIRRAVKGVDGQPILTPEQVAIYFFQPRAIEGTHAQVISPMIDRNGTIDSWPEGFFDQFDTDTAALIDW